MGEKEQKIKTAVKDYTEIIESERYNSEDPIIQVEKNDNQEQVIIKILTSERTGAPLKIEGEIVNTAEDLASKNFANGIRTLNSWQFRRSAVYLSDAANLARDQILQQRINLYKQLSDLLKSTIRIAPERIIKSKGRFFEEVLKLISKYDKLSKDEQNYYRKAINSLYGIAFGLENGDLKTLTQQLFARCTISLFNQEYLASYIWLYKIFLLNKEEFDKLAEKDEILKKALDVLKLYIEVETGLREYLDDLPSMASAFDLQTIFADYLNTIFDINFISDTKEKFSFPIYRENI
ncbi:MAG TPA: hypothetical protein VMX55_11790 [candidate division Zixibacteria bacterium]|nr:hypothetical protein [candidate division Zixibacteria bacterium]